MGISAGPSTVSMPDRKKPYPTLLSFLAERFPKIPEAEWLERILSGKVLFEDGTPVSLSSAYTPNKRLFYFREVAEEQVIPFKEQILFSNKHLLVACKPHFLPVTPGGPFVKETLIDRLKERTGNLFLSPIHRIDRATAGLVMISASKETRGLYQKLFMDGMVQKTYQAVVDFSGDAAEKEWFVETRIEKGEPWFRMRTVKGAVNARSKIVLLKTQGSRALLQLTPVTGKKHQLRIHLSGLGLPIVNDRYYPTLLAKADDDFNLPLQLLSKKIEFRDPVSGAAMSFESPRNLVPYSIKAVNKNKKM